MPSFEKLVILFGAYSCVGWVLECIFCSIKNKRLINRGFLNGPWCPIYGFGAISLVTILSPFQHNYWIFIPLAILVTTLIELVTGWAFERVLHMKLWDYSHRPFQFKGYICLEFSIIWGVLSALFVLFLHPAVERLVDRIPQSWMFPVSAAVIVLMGVDFIWSAVSSVKMSERIASLEKLSGDVKAALEKAHAARDERLSAWTEQADALKKRLEEQKAELSRKYRHRLRSHPTLSSRRFPSALEALRQLSSLKKQKKSHPEDSDT